MLVLQTVLLPLMLARSPSQLTLVGGTHNPNAPPFEFIERAFLPVIGRMGAAVHVSLLRHGFYPAGGGRVEVAITPTDILRPMSLPSRGRAQTTEVAATVANLPATIADRELAVIRKGLDLPNVTYAVREVDAYCAGNFVTITMTHQQASEVFCGFGAKGVRAEEVARDALNQARRYLSRDAAVSEHLADQLLLPCALAGSGDFTTLTPTLHFATNCDVIKAFLDIDIVTYELAPDLYHVKIGSSRSPSA